MAVSYLKFQGRIVCIGTFWKLDYVYYWIRKKYVEGEKIQISQPSCDFRDQGLVEVLTVKPCITCARVRAHMPAYKGCAAPLQQFIQMSHKSLSNGSNANRTEIKLAYPLCRRGRWSILPQKARVNDSRFSRQSSLLSKVINTKIWTKRWPAPLWSRRMAWAKESLCEYILFCFNRRLLGILLTSSYQTNLTTTSWVWKWDSLAS